jgi:hypothetical protein
MPIEHKFKQKDFENGLITHEAILDETPFKPEVLFLGTFNPNTDGNEMADFFYGRNWFWTAMFNIFRYQDIHFTTQRRFTSPLAPTLAEILKFCEIYKVTFADMISSVLPNVEPPHAILNNHVIYDELDYDLINDRALGELNTIGQVEWSTQHLIAYLERTSSIKTVYFTRQPANPFTTQWNNLRSHDYGHGRNISFKKIFTPSGQRMKGIPRMNHLIMHWLANNDPHYNRIDIDWIRQYVPDIANFVGVLNDPINNVINPENNNPDIDFQNRNEIPNEGIDGFEVVLGIAYYNQGFLNIGVQYQHHFGGDGTPVSIYLGQNAGQPIQGHVNRTANLNETPRIMGGRD